MASGNTLDKHVATAIQSLFGQNAQIGDQHQAFVGFFQGFGTLVCGALAFVAFAFVVVLGSLLRGFQVLLLSALGFRVKTGDAE